MHSCPVCDQSCYCSGDIDDVDVGDQDALENCIHCLDDGGDGGAFEDDADFDDDVEEEDDEDD